MEKQISFMMAKSKMESEIKVCVCVCVQKMCDIIAENHKHVPFICSRLKWIIQCNT